MSAGYYPVFLDLKGLFCLVVGLGSVGMRKLELLVPARPALVRVRDIRPPSEDAAALMDRARAAGVAVDCRTRFAEEDLDQVTLAYACSGDHALNAHVAARCRERRILCNCADDPSAGSFHLPVTVREGGLTLALSTDRASPALARRWKNDLAAFLAPRVPLARLMGLLRPMVLDLGRPSDENRDLFRRLGSPELERALAERDWAAARTLLESSLPEPLLPAVGRLLEEVRNGDKS